MTYQTTKGLFIPWPIAGSGGQSATDILLDAALESAAAIFQVPKTGTIDAVGFRTATVTTGATVDVRLETVSLTTGDPTGTLFGTNTNAAQVIADANDNTYFLTVLTAGASVTKGDLIAIVIVNPLVSAGNLNIAYYGDGFNANLPYADHFTATWAKSVSAVPCMTVRYNDGSYEPIGNMVPFGQTGTTIPNEQVVFSNSSTPDEIGMRFRFPFNVKVDGCWMWADIDNAADVELYDSDGVTPLTNVSLDSDVRGSTSNGLYFLKFLAEVTLLANTYYRLILMPTTSSNVGLTFMDVGTAAAMDTMPMGQDFHYTTAKDPSGEGSWTQTLTRRPWMGLSVTAIDDGGGGASNIFNILE